MMRLQLGGEDRDCGFGRGECCARRILRTGQYRLCVLSENNELCYKIVLTWFTGVRHKKMRTQVFDFVLVNLHLDNRSGGGSVSSYNHISLPRQCERCFHVGGDEERVSTQYDARQRPIFA
jgi:hypothetical protein